MQLTLQVDHHENRPVLTCHGHLICGEEAEAFQAALIRLLMLSDGLTLDLGKVGKIDCACLGVIANALRIAKQYGKSLELRSVSRHVQLMMEVTGLDAAFQRANARSHAGASAA